VEGRRKQAFAPGVCWLLLFSVWY